MEFNELPNLADDFQAAKEFLGTNWLENQYHEYYEDKEGEHLRGESPPELILSYHAARKVLSGEEPEFNIYSRFNESALRFLHLGRCIRLLSDTEIISKGGSTVSKELFEIYRSDLRTAGEHPWDFTYELNVAAFYALEGHEVAIIDEEDSDGRSPEFRIVDTDPEIDVECKRVRVHTDEEVKEKRATEHLLISTVDALNQNCIAYYDIDEVPTRSETETTIERLEQLPNIGSGQTIETDFGRLHLLPVDRNFPFEIYQETLQRNHMMEAAFRLLANPILEDKLGITRSLQDYGMFQIHMPARSVSYGIVLGGFAWVGTNQEPSHDESINRVKTQIQRTSGKFSDGRGALVHVDIPNRGLISRQASLDLRHKIKGELAERPSINAVISTSIEYSGSDESGAVSLSPTTVPNYFPATSIPEGALPFDLNSAKNIHQIMDDKMDEQLTAQGEEGIHRGIDRDEWSLDFKTGSGTFFESPIFKESESGHRAIYFGPSSGGTGGIIDVIDNRRGIYRIPIPDRMQGAGVCHVIVAFDGDELSALVGPIDRSVRKVHAIRRGPTASVDKVNGDIISRAKAKLMQER